MLAQERNTPQRVKANTVLPWVTSWADDLLHLTWLQAVSLSILTAQLILQPADPDTKTLASPTPPQPRTFGSGFPASEGVAASCPAATPSKPHSGAGLPAQCPGEQTEALVSVRDLFCLFGLAILLPPRLFSDALAEHDGYFCRRRAGRSPGNGGDAGMAKELHDSACSG